MGQVGDRDAARDQVEAGVVIWNRRGPVKVVGRAGGPDDEQVVVRRTGRMRELAHPHAAGTDGRRFILRMRKWRQRVHAAGLKWNRERIMVTRSDCLIEPGSACPKGGIKLRLAGRRVCRQAEQRAKSVVVQVVIVHDDDVTVADLCHKVKRLAAVEGADHWFPNAAIGPDRPDAPHPLIAQALTFVAAKHDPAILQWRGMQRAGDIDGCNERDVLAVIVHDEKLQGWTRVSLGRRIGVTIADKRDFAARDRTRTEIQEAVAEAGFLRAGAGRSGVIPFARAGVGGELLKRKAHDLAALQVDLVDVATGIRQIVALIVQRARAQIREVRIVTPLAIEGDERISDAAVAACDEHFLRAVGMQQHEVCSGIEPRRMEDLGPGGIRIVAITRLADIDDVVGEGSREGGPERGEQHNHENDKWEGWSGWSSAQIRRILPVRRPAFRFRY